MADTDLQRYKYNDVIRALELADSDLQKNPDNKQAAEDAKQLANIANRLQSEGKAPRTYTWGEVPVEAIMNFLPDAYEVGKGLIDAGMNPIDTGAALSDLGSSMIYDMLPDAAKQKLFSAEKKLYDTFPNAYKKITGNKTPEQVVTGYEQLSGDVKSSIAELATEEGLKRTLAEKPFSTLLTVSPAGKLIEKAGSKVRGVNTKYGGTEGSPLDKTGAFIEKTGQAINKPFDATVGLANKAVFLPLLNKADSTAKWLMQTALKPTKAQRDSGQADRAVKLLLENDIPLSEKGVALLTEKIVALDNEIKPLIQESPITIDVKKVAERTRKETKEQFKNQANPTKDFADIDSQIDQAIKFHPNKFSAIDAQQIKSGTYSKLKDKQYGEQSTAAIETQKQFARVLKEEIEKISPNIKPLNQQQGDFLNAINIMGDRLRLEANKNPLGSFAPIAPTGEQALITLADRSLPVKQLAARKLYNTSQYLKDPNIPFTKTKISSILNEPYRLPPNAGFFDKLGVQSINPAVGTTSLLQPDEEFTTIDIIGGQYPRP